MQIYADTIYGDFCNRMLIRVSDPSQINRRTRIFWILTYPLQNVKAGIYHQRFYQKDSVIIERQISKLGNRTRK